MENLNNILGLEEEIVLGTEFSLFPNHADNIFKLLFDMPTRSETDWIVHDQNGIKRLTGRIRKNEKGYMDKEKVPKGTWLRDHLP